MLGLPSDLVAICQAATLVIARRIATQTIAITTAGEWILKDISDHRSGVEVLGKRVWGDGHEQAGRKNKFYHRFFLMLPTLPSRTSTPQMIYYSDCRPI